MLASVGTAVWAVTEGIPLPLAIMGGVCMLAGTMVVAFMPMMVRALRIILALRSSASDESTVAASKPDYEKWRHVQNLTLRQVARLWCGSGEMGTTTANDTDDVRVQLIVIKDAVKSRKLKLATGFTPAEITVPQDFTSTTRDHLKAWAKANGWDPEFLRDG